MTISCAMCGGRVEKACSDHASKAACDVAARLRVRSHLSAFIAQTEPYPEAPELVSKIWQDEARKIAIEITSM